MFVVITQCLGDGEDQDKEDLTNMQLQKRLCWVRKLFHFHPTYTFINESTLKYTGLTFVIILTNSISSMVFLTGRATRLLWIIWKLMKD